MSGRRYERDATYSGEMQDLLIAMEAAMPVSEPPLTTFCVEGKTYKLTLERRGVSEVHADE